MYNSATIPFKFLLSVVLIFHFLFCHAMEFADIQWSPNSWGGAKFSAYITETCARNGIKGYYFQVDGRGNGDVEIALPRVLEPSKSYQFSVWLKAAKRTPAVDVFFRRDAAYYETTAIRTVTSSSTWTLVNMRGIYTLPSVGSVRLALRLVDSAVCISGAQIDEISPYTVGTPAQTKPVNARFFGTHLNQLGRHMAWPIFNPGTIRLWDTGTTWADLQPERGPINWMGPHARRLELFVRHVQRHSPAGDLLLTLGMTPTWAGSRHPKRCNNSSYGPSTCTAPLNMEDWRAYVREIARRFSGRIKYWEVWNEADIWVHWDDTPVKMVELVRVAYEELKAADPGNVVIGPNITVNGLRFLNNFLEAGGGKYVDGISVHAYFFRNPVRAMGSLRNVREILMAKGLSLPIWNTETGVGCDATESQCTTPPNILPASMALAQSMVGSAALGSENFGYYTWEGAGAEGLVAADFSTPTLQGLAYARIRRWIDGATLSYLPDPVAGVTLIQVLRNGARAYVAWASIDGTAVASNSFAGATRCQSLSVRSDYPLSQNQVLIGVEPMICMDDRFVFEDRWAQ